MRKLEVAMKLRQSFRNAYIRHPGVGGRDRQEELYVTKFKRIHYYSWLCLILQIY